MAAVIVLTSGAYAQGRIGGAEEIQVNLDTFIAEQKPAMPGTRTILPPKRVGFSARLKSHPEKIAISYLFEALSLMQVSPLPKVSHRMFLESAEGLIIPVYVEDAAVGRIRAKSLDADPAQFSGYHVYNYSKGPAIVVDGVE